jgi:hypothetical protein
MNLWSLGVEEFMALMRVSRNKGTCHEPLNVERCTLSVECSTFKPVGPWANWALGIVRFHQMPSAQSVAQQQAVACFVSGECPVGPRMKKSEMEEGPWWLCVRGGDCHDLRLMSTGLLQMLYKINVSDPTRLMLNETQMQRSSRGHPATKDHPALMKTTGLAGRACWSRLNPEWAATVGKIIALLLGLLAANQVAVPPLTAQTLLNIDFGVGPASTKTGFAATGQSTNDYWNLYRHYDPKFVPGTPLVSNGVLGGLKLADGTPTQVRLSVTNAPGVWGNASGDPMYDTYIFSQNGSNILVTLVGLEPGRYHFYLYGHADPDVTGEQNSRFTLHSGTNHFGPLSALGSAGWKATLPWQERYQYVVFRDVQIFPAEPIVIEVEPSPNGVPVLNGLQIISRGTSPPQLLVAGAEKLADAHTNLIYRAVRYDGQVSDTEARFAVDLQVESLTTNVIAGSLFEGDLALAVPVLPEGVRIVSAAKQYRLIATRPGDYRFKLDLMAKITRAEPWNQIAFTGPPAAIAAVTVRSATPGVEMQLLSGTQTEPAPGAPSGSDLRGFLAADRQLSIRWQSKAAEVARKSLVNVDTLAEAQVNPTVIKFGTRLRYEILQAGMPRLEVGLPAGQALTRVQGEQIRDWQVRPDGAGQLLTVELVKPAEKNYELSLNTEQTLETTPVTMPLDLPRPLGVERESGSFTVFADDMRVDIDSFTGLRQVNAPAKAVAAFRFHARPFSLPAQLRRIEPDLKVADRVTARLEETRLLVSHDLNLTVEKAGIYTLELAPPTGLVVAQVHGEGVEDWAVASGKLQVRFSGRVLGQRQLIVELEQAHRTFPNQITVSGVPVTGASRQTAQIGAAAALGIQIKTTGELQGLREIPAAELTAPSAELLAFSAETADWRLTLATEQPPVRMVADVFNLITVGDGLVGGSATIRYGLINQGVQTFRVRLPGHWRNVDFIGPNIRRKERVEPEPAAGLAPNTNQVWWAITLQDKAWGGYTLVLTYDYPFEPKRDTLDLRGAHVPGAERETGSVALTTAANLQLQHEPIVEPLRVIDPTELAETDRVLVSRPVLLAYQYTGADFQLNMNVMRHEEIAVLDAVADRTQLASALNEEGQMLTQAGFMVKNNDKQFQKILLPAGAVLWGCYVNNQPVKAETNGGWVLISLPRGANRDEAFAVDLVYKQTFDRLKSRLFPKTLKLAAPQTDVPNTYAEWQLYVPESQRLSAFAGNMTVARGTTYQLRDAWREFMGFYAALFHKAGPVVLWLVLFVVVATALILRYRLARWPGVVTLLVLFAILALLVGMFLPALSKAKSKAGGATALNNLKQQRDALTAGQSALQQPGQSQSQAAQETQQRVTATAPAEQPAPPSVTAPAPPPSASSVFMLGAALAGTGAGGAGDTSGGVAGLLGPAPTGAGVRSIRIDIPKTGRPFHFTKVLNVRDEPLAIQMRVMPAKVFQIWRSALQLVCFLAGLLMFWHHWRRPQPRSLKLTVGVALALGAVASLLITWRALHLAFIAAAPLLVFLLLFLLLRRGLRRRDKTKPGPPPSPDAPPGLSPVPPVATGLLLLGFLCVGLGGTTRLWAAPPSVPEAKQPDTNTVSILAATYSGRIQENVAVLDASIQLSTAATNQTIALFQDDVAIQSFETDGEARLLRQDRTVAVWVGDIGQRTLRCKLAVRLSGDVTKRLLTFAVPPALISRLDLTLEEPDADVEFPSAVTFKRVTDKKQTRVEAIVGAGGSVDMRWTPRMKRAAEMEARVFCQSTMLVTVGGGVVNLRSTLDYQIAQGELRQAKVLLPAGQRLLRVEGEFLRTWEIVQSGGESVLQVDLVKGVTSSYRLTVESEFLLGTLPAQVAVTVPHALDVIRNTGLIALRSTEEIALTVETTQALQRVDAAEFAKASPAKAESISSVYQFLRREFQLIARAETVRPEIEAVIHHGIRAGFDQVVVRAQVDYVIKKAGVFSLRLALPAGYKVESVTGSNIQQWNEKGDPPTLEVSLQERAIGPFQLQVALSRSYPELPATLEAVGVHPLNVSKLTGYLAVAAELGLGVKTGPFTNLTEVPAAALPASTPLQSVTASEDNAPAASVLAFKYITTTPGPTPNWSLRLVTETLEPWVRAEIAQVWAVSETWARGRAQVRYEIQNAPLKEFRLQAPSSWKNIEISGANIRRRDQTNGQWTVELQNKVRGTYTLVVTWEQPRTASSNNLDLTGLRAAGMERETGYLIILARPPLQVQQESKTDELIQIDARELPEWTGVLQTRSSTTEAPVLVYRYLRPGFALGLAVRRFDEAAVLQALVDNGQLTTVVADDGQSMTEMKLAIRNNGLQHLTVLLPLDSIVWSAFVAGQPVRPTRETNQHMLPLERSTSDDTPLSVELTFIGPTPFPKAKGRVRMLSPRLNVPLKNMRWDLYLPPDYEYDDFEGSMQHETAAAPVVKVYSQSDYSQQEQQQKSVRRSKVQTSLSNVRSQLAKGELQIANEDLNRAAALNTKEDLKANQELETLQNEIARAQGSNLLEAQRAYVSDNFLRFNQQRLQVPAQGKATPTQQAQPSPQAAQAIQYDAAAAEQQWRALARAQEITVTRVQPLRVNLPTRGLHHAFTQALQTETDKPMSILFQATNTRKISWFTRLIYLAGGFVALWIAVSRLSRRAKSHRARA